MKVNLLPTLMLMCCITYSGWDGYSLSRPTKSRRLFFPIIIVEDALTADQWVELGLRSMSEVSSGL